MKFRTAFLLPLASCGVLACLCGTAGATTVLVDFGRSATATTGVTDTYNNVYFDDGSITEGGGQNLSVGPVALVDTSNTATGWSIQVAGGDIGNAGGGADVTTAPAAISGFEQSAWGDNMFIEIGAPATISITGLDDSKTYDLLFYGSRTNLGTTQTWSLTKGTGGSNVVHSSNNPTTAVNWTGLSTDGNGEIEFTITSGNTGALNFGSITQVPEPSGASLLGLALGLLVCRRKRAKETVMNTNATNGRMEALSQSNRTCLPLCLSGILACLSGTAGAAPALIDFGRSATETTGAGDTYNNVYFGDGSITEGGGQNLSVGPVALVDTSNTATGWSIQVAGGDIGNAGGGADVATAPAAISGFEESAWGDNMFIEHTAPAIISITGLDDTKTYDLLFYGSRANLGTDQTWSLTKGSGGSDVEHDSEDNTTIVVDWNGLSTDGNGEIEFTITSGNAGALNFGSITESTGSPSLAVTSFTATPVTLGAAGDAVTFDWAVTGLPLDSLVITPGDIEVLGDTDGAGVGSYLLDPGPDVTTEYTLTATKGGDTATSMVSVTVPGTGSQALIDFGRSATETTGADDTYNNVYFGDGSITDGGGQNLDTGTVALVDTSNGSTGWSIQVAGGDIGNAGGGADVATAPAAISGFEQSAWGDNMFIESGTATISITGLDDSKTYDLLFYGSRTNLPTTQTWSLTKGSGGSNVVHSSNNPTTAVDWTGLSTDGNGEIEFTITTTGQVSALNFGSITESAGGGGGSAFDTWVGTTGSKLGFDEDKNSDGISNGMAFLLGAADPDVDASDKLPTATEDGSGGLVMTFQMLDSASRGTAALSVQHSGDLGATDPWGPLSPAALVPDTSSTVEGVIFGITGSGTLNVTATIPSAGNAMGGKLFGRLLATD